MKDTNIAAMINSLSMDISDKLVWNKAMVIEQLSINVEASRNASQFAASNRSIELLAKAIGNVFEPETQLNGTVSVIHSLSDSVLEQLEAMVAVPVPIVDADTIEADYKIVDSEEI